MQADYLDRYSRLDSPLHRQPAGGKVMVAMAVVVIAVTLPRAHAIWLAPLATLLIVLALVSQVPLRYLGQRMLLLEPLVVGVAVLSLLQSGGWQVFVLLISRTSICLLAMLLLANTTPFSDLLRVLRRAHLPGLIITTLMLMYRYLFVLVDESIRMKRARAARTFAHKRLPLWRNTATIIGQLFIRASERGERIFAAMCARGWQ